MENLRYVLAPARWMKGEARINGEYVELDSSHAKGYSFGGAEASRRMAFDLAALPWPDPTDRDAFAGKVKAFVRKHGLLRYGADYKNTGLLKEPLDEWLGHALTLGYLGNIYLAIRKSLDSKSAEPVRNALREYGQGIPHVSFNDPGYDERYIHEATWWLAHTLNAGMHASESGQYRWGISAEGPGDLHLAQCPPDLQSHAYATFAVLMVSKAPMKTCPGCGRLFSPRDSRQKWHAPGCGSTKRGQERRARLVGK